MFVFTGLKKPVPFDQNKLGNLTLINKMTILQMAALLVSC